MCYRYYMELSPELRPIIEEAQRSVLAFRMADASGRTMKTEGEIRPTDIAPVIASNPRAQRSVFPMIWGFTGPVPAKDGRSQMLANCRVESADSKPTWRDSWSRRRCAIPASGYFEWEHLGKKTGDKYSIRAKEEPVCYLAGLYRIEDGFPHFAVLTRDPSEDVRFIHDRMPLILPSSAVNDWINPASSPEIIKQIAAASLTAMEYENLSVK